MAGQNKDIPEELKEKFIKELAEKPKILDILIDRMKSDDLVEEEEE